MPFIQRGPTHNIPYIDVRLDEDVVVFRGSSDESNGALLKGLVAVCVRETTKVQGISLTLQGVRRLHWYERQLPPVSGLISTSSRTVKHEEVFFEKKWNFLENSSGHTLYSVKPNNYEYPFSIHLEGSLPESVEGLMGAHVVYRLKARIVRGKFSHDITAKKHLRVIRMLAPGSQELMQTMSVENLWPEKIEYSISIPTKAVVFGTSIPVDVVLVPLLKGLSIGNVIISLKEVHTLTCPNRTITKTETRNILTQTFTSGELEETGEEELGRWVMHDRVALPKSLNACVQDVDVPSIKVKHKLKFTVQLHNPDGHMSELRASLPVLLFISPNYLMDDSNRIPSNTPADDGELTNAPPRYDEHYLDRLYENVAQESFETPLPSGANTPRLAASRNSSSENLASLTLAGLPDANSRRWTAPSSTALSPHSEDSSLPDGYFSPATPNTRTPSPVLEDLSRVPSYTTAVRAGTRNLGDVTSLPLYEEAESRFRGFRSAPVSPQNSPPGLGHMFPFPIMSSGSTTGSVRLPAAAGGLHSGRSSTGGFLAERRNRSSHHLHSLGDLLEGLRG